MNFHRYRWQPTRTKPGGEPSPTIEPPENHRVEVGPKGAWHMVGIADGQALWQRLCIAQNVRKPKKADSE